MDKIIYWGTPAIAVPALRALADQGMVAGIVTKADSARGRHWSVKESSPVAVFGRERGLPILQPERLKEEFRTELSRLLPATFLVFAYGKIIPASVLALSEKPAINIHPSLLPLLRGPSPIESAILKGFTETGITLMQLDEEVDHGPILFQKKITLNPDETAVSLTERIAKEAEAMIVLSLQDYLAGRLTPVEQNHALATVTRLFTPEDGLLDRSKSAVELERVVRALNPRPGTTLVVDALRLKILEAKAIQTEKDAVFSRDGDSLLIRCGEGSLAVRKLQMPGGKPLASADFLRGYARTLGIN